MVGLDAGPHWPPVYPFVHSWIIDMVEAWNITGIRHLNPVRWQLEPAQFLDIHELRNRANMRAEAGMQRVFADIERYQKEVQKPAPRRGVKTELVNLQRKAGQNRKVNILFHLHLFTSCEP